MTPRLQHRGVMWLRTGLLLVVLLIVASLVFFWWDYDPIDRAYGSFDGRVSGTWDDDGRDMSLNEDFAYIDPRGKRWTAKAGSTINGASIPRIFWSVIGGPFEGRFRNASVVHDAACGEQTESWQDAHRMFYDAMRCGRVGEGKAQTMFWAVFQFGPRWERVPTTRIEDGKEVTVVETITEQPEQPKQQIVPKAERYFNKKQFTTEEIEKCTVEQIEAEVAKWDAAKKPAG